MFSGEGQARSFGDGRGFLLLPMVLGSHVEDTGQREVRTLVFMSVTLHRYHNSLFCQTGLDS